MSAYLDLVMFAALMAAVLSGFPVAFAIGGVAIAFAYLGWLTGAMDIGLLGAMGQRVFGLLSNEVLIAIPLFVLMGGVLEKSRIAERLLTTMGQLFGALRGGLGISVVLVGALLAASTGIVGATVVAMGLIALPAMLRAGYNPAVASGIVCTAGTLGQIIPPSTLLIILSDVMSNAYQQAQYEQGKFAVETLSVGQVFAAALLPGLLLVGLYIAYILGRGLIRPGDLPPLPQTERPPLRDIMGAILPPILLIIAVLGSILCGLASPTEAAAVGAVGALLLAAYPHAPRAVLMAVLALIIVSVLAGVYPVRLQRSDLTTLDYSIAALSILLILIAVFGIFKATGHSIRSGLMANALTGTAQMTAMIFATILAAGMFSLVFVGLGGEDRVADLIAALPGGPTGALICAMLVIFVLGFFLDFVEISVIVLPLVAPQLILMGHDPLWLSVLIAINLQTSFLTPPFGFSLFYLRGAAPPEVTTGHIYAGVIPFIGLQILSVVIIWHWGSLSQWLPQLIYG